MKELKEKKFKIISPQKGVPSPMHSKNKSQNFHDRTYVNLGDSR